MIKKILKVVLLVFVVNSCGYSPMYKNVENDNFSINLNQISGDRVINNKIKSKLLTYTLESKEKNYEIDFTTNYSKNIVAKDTTGAATEYKIILDAEFIISTTNIEKNLKFKETFNMQSFSDKLEEQDYEENVKNSLTNIIARKLILQLSKLK